MALSAWITMAAQVADDAPSIIVQTESDATDVICNGTSTNGYLPVYANRYGRNLNASQWIYPSTYFVGNNGIFRDVPSGSTIKINKISFHASTTTIPNSVRNASVEVRIGELDGTTTIANENAMNSNRSAMGDPVFSGSLSSCCDGQTMTITLNVPYEYQGKNLIVDFNLINSSSNSTCNWYGITATNGSGCNVYGGIIGNTSFSRQGFLPKMTVDYSYTKWESPSVIDFGGVLIGAEKTLQAKINNPGAATTAVMSTTEPFAVNPTTLNVMANGETPFELKFSPTQSTSYSGNLNLEINEQTASLGMRGVGFKAGDKAIRDEAFFEGIEYTWKEWQADGNGQEHTNNLAEVATDPDQIIAMLKEVYTNRTIPGNYKRGYSNTGGSDHDDDVIYTGVGRIPNNNATVCDDSYGWDIPGNVLSGSNDSYNFRYMDPNQYKPYYEGVTLLLLEIVDTFTPTSTGGDPTHNYKKLRDYFASAVKSARVVTQAKRVGNADDAFSSGTLFKIDCDKMNKFYLIAKGQLGWLRQRDNNANNGSIYSFYGYPMYYNNGGGYLDYGLYGNYLDVEPAFLCHMFEQLSPAEGSDESNPLSDGYQMFVTEMKSFGIEHDCPNVPFVYGKGHHFMMYGPESLSADCQDIRDMMLIVPDYRMMNWDGRGSKTNPSTSSTNRSQDYFNYHQSHQPSIGVFVIHQDEITDASQVSGKELYKHSLKWKSNLDDFLPGIEQEYELWEIVVDDFGVESYQPVYYRNANGDYTDKDGNVVQTRVPIVLDRVNLSSFTYTDVYVDMTEGSQTKTYVIRGRDKDGFLSLQMSNQQEVFIPGLDPNEKAHMVAATYYSRFNPDNKKNCYSNKLEMTNNGLILTESDLDKTLYFYRSSRDAQVDDNGNVITDAQGNIQYVEDATKELVATAVKSGSGNVLNITIANPIDDSEFPKGRQDGKSAGYHANAANMTVNYTVNSDNTINFVRYVNNRPVETNLSFWDNFTVDVSNNAHPLQYLYRMEVGEQLEAYSNNARVPIYKTDSKINVVSLEDVLGDTQMSDEFAPGDVEFQAQVQMSSKTEILRYDAYRWLESEKRYIVEEGGTTDEDEEDSDPTGIAGNQGGWYTVSMNENTKPYYYTAPSDEQPTVDETNPTNWATFVDKYPTYIADSSAYIYAPAVELFTKGYYENSSNPNSRVPRKDYNTYGGPLKNVAVGKMKVTMAEPDIDHPLMSDYRWFNDEDGKWYSYYTIYLQFDTLNIPRGYELYKVRAWRKVDRNLLGEEIGTRQSRIDDIDADGWYMYEDINFGDALEHAPEGQYAKTMSAVTLKSALLGDRPTDIPRPTNPEGYSGGPGGGSLFERDETLNPNAGEVVEDLVRNEVRATFGALRMKTANDDSGSLEELDASFKVRAYFTKNTNPLITNNSGYDPIYVVGADGSGNAWDYSTPLTTLYTLDGTTYTGTFAVPNAGDGNGYFSFTNQLGAENDIWNHRFGVEWNDGNATVAVGTTYNLICWGGGTKAIQIPAGTYKLTITNYTPGTYTDGQRVGNIVVAPATANAPRRAEGTQPMPGSGYDYYIAEGIVENIKLESDNIITGISAVRTDVNREVVGVTYVNTVGMVSSMPWQGVNIVVTRYSDGSTTTRKVVR